MGEESKACQPKKAEEKEITGESLKEGQVGGEKEASREAKAADEAAPSQTPQALLKAIWHQTQDYHNLERLEFDFKDLQNSNRELLEILRSQQGATV